jgi:hypothetical protein
MDLIYSSLVTYCSITSTGSSSQSIALDSLPFDPTSPCSHSAQDILQENYQILNKNICNLLMSTIGGVIFFQSQFLDIDGISSRLNISCGKIISMLSEMNQEGANFHLNQILKQCLEPQAEVRGTLLL